MTAFMGMCRRVPGPYSCVCVFTKPTGSPQMPAECLKIQISSDTIYLEIESDSTGKGLGLVVTLHFRGGWQVQVVTCASD